MAVVKWREPAAEIMSCQTNFIYDEITQKCRNKGKLNTGEGATENNNKPNNNNNNNNNNNDKQTHQKIWWQK
jgi:hypothetical protein